MGVPDSSPTAVPRLRQPRRLNKAYAWLVMPNPGRTLGCSYSFTILVLGPVTLLSLWLRARQGLPVSTADWILGACSGILCGLIIHAVLRWFSYADRSVGSHEAGRGISLHMTGTPPCRVPGKRLLGVSLKPETTFPDCLRLTVTFKDRLGRRQEWFMLVAVEDEAAAREFLGAC